MPFDIGRAHRVERGRLPARRLVLVDDHRSYPLVEIAARNDSGGYPEFSAHALVEIEHSPPPQQRQRDLEAGRRFGADQGGRAARKCGIGAFLGAFIPGAANYLLRRIRVRTLRKSG